MDLKGFEWEPFDKTKAKEAKMIVLKEAVMANAEKKLQQLRKDNEMVVEAHRQMQELNNN